MQSNNPVFARSQGFNGKGGTAYADFGAGLPSTHVEAGTGRMTIDTVVQKTAFTLGVVVLVAAGTWILTGDIVDKNTGLIDDTVARQLYTISLIGAFGGFALSMVNSFKRVISPALVIAFAAFEGLMVGAFSKVVGQWVGDGVVVGAVLGTVAAVAGVLAAYKFFDIQVGNRFRKWTVGMMFGFVGVSLL